MKSKIRKVTHPHAWELLQARIDEAAVTNQPMVERPFWYEADDGRLYHDLYGCVGWPTEVSDKDGGMPGYVAVVGVVKMKEGAIQDSPFRLMAEGESRDVPSLLDMIIAMREEWGFGLHPELLHAWFGDPERFVTTIALKNERMDPAKGILISPPDEFYGPTAFDEYVRSIQSVIVAGRVRFYFGGCEILKNKLREFRRDNPAVMAVGGLVHTLLSHCEWMDQARENMFVVEEGENV
ncbi:MAG: hypothetical protein WAZ60_23720 [Desulfosalsimonadaceae bacterium]